MTRPPLLDMILSQILFWGISLTAASTCYAFYKSVNGRLRVLTIYLFASLSWQMFIAGTYYLIWDFGYLDGFPTIFVRVVSNSPLFLSILLLWDYIRNKK